ncbi:hypothetical protein Nepgr_015522 [Nepenthes gracilis]|uniref:tRNA(Ile)-lysidine synthetase n=1 Tax=Nepenthes gracilis TaxID=150966 RepID=A0AAD3XRD0_NEPGR|nr:hypothetical protein Nepgr_015522 [Nepenthes gracilis]
MTQGLAMALSPHARNTSAFVSTSSIFRICPTKYGNRVLSPILCRRPSSSSTRFLCKCSGTFSRSIDISNYNDAFARRMAMAGLKPHHRIALGVSGGPDSMALCVLMVHWKANTATTAPDSNGIFDGLLAIIVDHGLRLESKEEADVVRDRVSNMGIRCEVARCEWSDGRPKQGHLQEAARDMRYRIFSDICIQNQIGVLLTAHHADDQAELFVLRLSRNSGVLGLAGMPFSSQLFLTFPLSDGESSNSLGIVLVRPLLEFSKEDLYKICEGDNKKWVEDPTNQSALFARNRIRMALSDMASSKFKSEIQAVIYACRKTRSYVDHICFNLINQVVNIRDHGYAVIDLKILDPLKRKDICLSKFLVSVLQFISQRHRPVRGSASRLLLEYIRTFPCQTSLTAAGCYLSAAPGTKGTKVLVCCSVESALPSKMELLSQYSDVGHQRCISEEVEEIIMEGKSYKDRLIPDASDVQFLDAVSSDSVLDEAKRLSILSDSTYRSIIEMKRLETRCFKENAEVFLDSEENHSLKTVNPSSGYLFQCGQSCYFMNRFLITWRSSENNSGHKTKFVEDDVEWNDGSKSCHSNCNNGHIMVANIRHMIEDDWLYLAKLSQCQDSSQFQYQSVVIGNGTAQPKWRSKLCADYASLSAGRALLSLKSVPVAARRSLPVLVSQQGMLLSIPCIGFRHCPCLVVSVVFKPRLPLGAGHILFI